MKLHATLLFTAVAMLSLLTSVAYAEPTQITLTGDPEGYYDYNDYELTDKGETPAVKATGDPNIHYDDNNLGGNLTLVGTATFDVTGIDLYLLEESTLSGNSDATWVKVGSADLVINSSKNEFSGAIVFEEGAIYLEDVDAIYKAKSVTTDSPIHLDADQTINDLSGSGKAILYADKNVTLTLNYENDKTYDALYQDGTGGVGSLKKTGKGTMTMTATQSYTGTTTIDEGTIKYTGDPNANSKPITVNKNGTAEFAQSTNVTFSTGMAGEGTFRKTGTGNLQIDTTTKAFDVANVKVEAGKLQFSGTMGGNLYVTTGGSGEGVTSGTFDIGFTTDPKQPVVGTANVKGNLTLDGGIIQYDFNSTTGTHTPGVDFDTMVLGGTANLNDGTFFFTFGGITGGAETTWYNLSKNDGVMYLLMETDSVKGDLSKILLDGVSQNWQIANTTYGDKQGIFLLAAGIDPPIPPTPPTPGSGVPEPSTWALLILGSIGLMYIRRRK